MNTDYNAQAKKFLDDTGTTLEIIKAVPQKHPLWHKENENHGINYYCTLSRYITKDGRSKLETYGFDFWDSIKIKEDGKRPTAYDVLACLSITQEDNLKDFCDSFGYDEDSRLAEKTFNACMEQNANLRRLFTDDELEALDEIQ